MRGALLELFQTVIKMRSDWSNIGGVLQDIDVLLERIGGTRKVVTKRERESIQKEVEDYITCLQLY